jgi:Ca2+-binding EF-hand superfamily protein
MRTKLIFFHISLLSFALAFSFAMPAQAGQKPPADAKLPAEKYHPFVLHPNMRLRAGLSEYEFGLLTVEMIFSGRTREQNERKISLALMEKKNDQLQRQARLHQLKEALRYDWNYDMKVTKEELANGINVRSRKTISHNVDPAMPLFDKFMALDTNKDGILSYEEMSAPTKIKANGYSGISVGHNFFHSDIYRAVDTNKDGFIITDEILAESVKAFKTIDLDKDQTLSEAEFKKFQEERGLNAHDMRRVRPPHVVPPHIAPLAAPPVKSPVFYVE